MQEAIPSNHVFEKRIEIKEEEKLKAYRFLHQVGEPTDDNNNDDGQEDKLKTFIFLRHGMEPPKDNNNDDGHEDLPSPKVKSASAVLQDEPAAPHQVILDLPPMSRQNSGQLQNSNRPRNPHFRTSDDRTLLCISAGIFFLMFILVLFVTFIVIVYNQREAPFCPWIAEDEINLLCNTTTPPRRKPYDWQSRIFK